MKLKKDINRSVVIKIPTINSILKEIWHLIRRILIVLIPVGVIVTVTNNLGAGILTYLISVILFSFIVYLIRRKQINEQIMMCVRMVESQLFGKPLDKEYWDDEEWKNRKKKKQ